MSLGIKVFTHKAYNKNKQRSLKLDLPVYYYDDDENEELERTNYIKFLFFSRCLKSTTYPGINETTKIFNKRLEYAVSENYNVELRKEMDYQLLNSKFSPQYIEPVVADIDSEKLKDNLLKFSSLKDKITNCL